MSEKRCMGCMRIKKNSPVCEHCGYDEEITIPSFFLIPGILLKNRYIVGKHLRWSSYTIEYIGWDQVQNRTVAIREYFPRVLAQRWGIDPQVNTRYSEEYPNLFPRNRGSFAREGRVLAKLCAAQTVSGIAQVLDVAEENNSAYMIMEYAKGTTLDEYVKQKGGTLTMEQTLKLLSPIMMDLEIIHKDGMLHRMLESGSVLILPNGSAKLLDFGEYFQVQDDESNFLYEFSEPDIFFPKNPFMAMELYTRKGIPGPWTDVYAMSGIVYFCLTGKNPPYAPNRFLEDEEINWDQVADLNQTQADALRQGLAIRHKDRIQSMPQLCEKLQDRLPVTQRFEGPAPVQWNETGL